MRVNGLLGICSSCDFLSRLQMLRLVPLPLRLVPVSIKLLRFTSATQEAAHTFSVSHSFSASICYSFVVCHSVSMSEYTSSVMPLNFAGLIEIPE